MLANIDQVVADIAVAAELVVDTAAADTEAAAGIAQ